MASKTWSTVDLSGVALFNFTPNGPCQIALQLGDIVKITEQSEHWFRGIIVSKEPKRGIFPRRYIGVFKYRDPVLKELQTALSEWLRLLRSHYKDRKFSEFSALRNRMVPIVELCRKLSAVSMDDKLYGQMRAIIESKMEDARRAVASELLIRLDGGDIATEKNTGIIKLCKLHEDAARGQSGASASSIALNRSRSHSLANVRENLESTAPASGQSFSTLRRGKVPKPERQKVNLMVNVQAFMCPVGEPADLFISVWNRTNGKFLSEEYRAEFTAQGMPADIQKIGALKNLFRDLPAPVTGANDDESVDLVLVVRIVRKGKMVPKEGLKGPDYRRPWGGAVLALSTVGLGKPEQEFTLPVFSPSDEKTFATLHEAILKNSGVEAIPKAKGIVCSVMMFQGETPAKYRDDPVTRPLAFPEPLLPGVTLNDFWVTMEMAEITQDRPGQQKNLEVLMKVRHDQGAFLTDCIHLGNGDKARSEYRSLVYYHNNSPRWNETFRLSLPAETFNHCHMYFEFRLGTKQKEKPAFAVSYFKPTKLDGTVVDDTRHVIQLLRPTKLENEPWYLKQLGAQDPKNIRKGEQLTISTLLVSTQLTKNISLLSLLRWKMVPQNMGDVLKRVTFVSPVEIRRFLNDTFDALFSILDAHSDQTQLVYEAIVYIISVFLDDKAMRSDERDALDLYISKHFNAPTAHRQLMSMLKRTFTSSEPNAAKGIGLSLKALEYLFKLVIASRVTYNKRAPSTTEDTSFKRDILDFFKAFNALMSKTGPTMIGTQTIALKGFSAWFNDMSQIFNATELAHIAVTFLDSVQVSEKASPVNAEKLIVIHHLVRGPLFTAEEPRSVLLPALLKHVKTLLDRLNPDESDTAILLIMGIIEALESPGRLCRNQSDALSLLGLLPGLLILIKQLSVLNDPRRVRLVVCVLAILHMGSGTNLEVYVKSLEPAELQNFQITLLRTLSSFIASQSLPPNWFALVMFQHSATLYLLHTWTQELLSSRRSAYGVTADEAARWDALFELCVAFIRSKALQLEAFPSSKRDLLTKKYGDYRLDAVEILRQLWNASGQFVTTTTVELVTVTLTLTMIDQPEIRQIGMDMYTSLLDREFAVERDFLRMTKLSIDALDVLSATPEFDITFADFFLRSVQEKFAQASEQSHKGREFTNAVRELLELTQALRARPVDSGYDDDRTSAAIKLMDYLRQADRKDSYIRYIYLLVNEHFKCGRSVEAGNTILLHADLLEWRDDKILEKQGDYGKQSERERKEQIFRTAIEYFTKGKHYERAISLYEDLKQIYRDILFDYTSLASVLEQQSKLYLLLNDEERVFHDYFRVAFFGAAFPPAIRNKEFIYRGFDFERIAEFVTRIQTRYPKAEMLKFVERPPPAYYTADKMYIQIFNVRASSLDEAEGNSRSWNERVPPSIRRFQEFNNVNVFVFSKRVKKPGAEDDHNPFKSLWLLNTFYETAEPLPSIQHRSEVISTVEIETAPLDNALKALEAKNFELQQMVTKYSQKSETLPDLKPLSMLLKGTITAVVNGGIKNYAEAFFTDDYTMSQPMKVDALKRALQQHSALLGKLMKEHGARVATDSSLRGLHEDLEQNYSQLSASVGEMLRD